MIPTKQFVRDLADLEADGFEQLVYALVLRDHPSAQKLKAPDFGADVLDDPDSKEPRVWQVKHYPGPIHWADCQKSLDRAISKWRPVEVTFVFPRDLTGKDQQDFTEKLASRHAIPVRRCTASRLNEQLEKYPEVRRTYFPHRTSEVQEILRAAHLSEEPAGGPAFLDHGIKLSELAQELDPNFDYEVSARPERLSRPFSGPKPFMSVRVRGEGHESVLAAWAKPEASPAEPSWSFTDDEAGERARSLLYCGVVRGETVELSDGVVVRADPAPTAIKNVLDQLDPDMPGEMTSQRHRPRRPFPWAYASRAPADWPAASGSTCGPLHRSPVTTVLGSASRPASSCISASARGVLEP